MKAVHATLTSARVERIPSGWRFRDFGGLRTVRMDGEERHVDWSASPGILGAKRMKGALYLHLATASAEVRFAAKPKPLPHVLEADHRLLAASRDATGVSAISDRVARGEILLAGFPPGAALRVRIDDRESEEVADESGRARIEFPRPGRNRMEVRVR